MSHLIDFADPAPGWPSAPRVLAVVVALLAAMIVLARLRRPFRDLLASDDFLLWLAGALLLVSAFPTSWLGPWGVGLSAYGRFTWNWGFPKIVYAFPEIWYELLGAVIAITAFACMIRRTPFAGNARWIVVSICLGAIPLSVLGLMLHLRMNALPGRPPASSVWIMSFLSALVIAGVVLTVARVRDVGRRNLYIHLWTAIWMSSALLIPLAANYRRGAEQVLRTGFWLMVAGILMLFVVCIRGLRRHDPPAPGRCPACGYDLTGNESGKCPECGTASGSASAQTAPSE